MTWSWLPHLRMHGAGVDGALSNRRRCRGEARIGSYRGFLGLPVLLMAVMMIMVVVPMMTMTHFMLVLSMVIVMMMIVAAMLSH